MKYEDSITAREYREWLLNDMYRPGFHFSVPDGDGRPGDPNGAFFADGRYHLMYLYRNGKTKGFHWGHVSSIDLIHWRNHRDALTVENGDEGCYSGGAFVDEDGTAYLTFWKFPSKNHCADGGGIDIACSKPPYEEWKRLRPVAIEGSREIWGTLDICCDGKVEHVACADPSNIWKMNGHYYMQTGNLCVLDAYGRGENSDPHYRGDWTDLFRSDDLKTWKHVHRFYTNSRMENDWPDETEDDMCPSFLPLPDRPYGGKLTDHWLQLFIAHNRGAQYYVGTLEGEIFVPQEHGRFSRTDNTCFAPEALIDGKNRQIAWYWLLGNRENEPERFGWSGVYSLPRMFWYDQGLRVAPIPELKMLEYNEQHFDAVKLDGEKILPVKNGRSFHVTTRIAPKGSKRIEWSVLSDPLQGEETVVYLDFENGEAGIDASHAGSEGRRAVESESFTFSETMHLDIYVDCSVVEMFLNERIALVRQVFPSRPDKALQVSVRSDGAEITDMRIWEMMPSNPY